MLESTRGLFYGTVTSVLSFPCGSQGARMEVCNRFLDGKRHASEHSSCSVPEYNDLEAAEALVCMSFWSQMSPKPNVFKPRPLTPASDSCDSVLQPEPPETPKDFVSLSSLVSPSSTQNKQLGSQICMLKAMFNMSTFTLGEPHGSLAPHVVVQSSYQNLICLLKTWGGFYDTVDRW